MKKIKTADSINNDEDEEKMMPKNGILIDFYTMCVCRTHFREQNNHGSGATNMLFFCFFIAQAYIEYLK